MSSRRRLHSYDVVVAGYLGVDLAPGFPIGRAAVPAAKFFRPGELIETEGLTVSLGGVVANTGLALKKFGCRVELMGLVGRDPLGDVALSQLRSNGLSGSISRTDQAGTAYGIVLAPPGSDRMFLEDPGCNRHFCRRHIDFQTVARCRIFHFGYPPLMERMWAGGGAELTHLFRQVRRMGVVTSLDLSLPDVASPSGRANWRRILARVLPFVDIFVPSAEEIAFMLPSRVGPNADPRAHIERLATLSLGLGAKIVMIKCGDKGAFIRTGEMRPLIRGKKLKISRSSWNHRAFWAKPFSVSPDKFENASGAGDCAVAGWLAAILRGVDLDDAAKYAMRAGRDNLYSRDAYSGLSDWTSMTAQIGEDPI